MNLSRSNRTISGLALSASALLWVLDAIPDHRDPVAVSEPAKATARPAARDLHLHIEMPRLGHGELVANSDRIVAGTVRAITPFEFRTDWISRRVTVDVIDSWGMSVAHSIDVVVHGGTLDGRQTRCDHSPDFEVGNAYVFYLQSPWDREEYVLSALDQAVVPMTGDGRGSYYVGAGSAAIPLADYRSADEAARRDAVSKEVSR